MVDFGSQNGAEKTLIQDFVGYFWVFKNALRFCLILDRLQDRPRGAREAPRPPQEAPRGLQERPKRPQEASKSAPGGPKRASRDPKSRSRGFKTRPRAPKSLPRRPQGFSEAPGPTAVFGKIKRFKSWLQKASKTLKVADIDESQRPCHKSQNDKRRAGGGDPSGEVNPPPASEGRSRACIEEVF